MKTFVGRFTFLIWLIITVFFITLFAKGCRESYVRSFCSTPIGVYGPNSNRVLSKELPHNPVGPIDWWDDWEIREHISPEFYFHFVFWVLILMMLNAIIPLYFLNLFLPYWRKGGKK
jgi:hypothetical protein